MAREPIPQGRRWKLKPDSYWEYEEPVTRPDPHDNSTREATITTHPAFGQISASRVTGQAYLYGSDFSHRGYTIIRVEESELRRDLARDWYHPRGRIIEVAVSEAQWATFVSTLNAGEGAPCTILNTQQGCMTGQRPELPPPPSRTEQFEGEAADRVQRSIDALDRLDAKLAELKISEKQRAELRGAVRVARQELDSNIPFVAKAFGKYAQTVVERAKVEVSAYDTRVVTRLGLRALAAAGEETEKPLIELAIGGDQSPADRKERGDE